jgi:aryl-alcohol dehydrogenase-like predicted oxidoreductase
MTTNQTIPRRPYGSERIPISVVGFGGMLVAGEEQPVANRRVAEAVERGVNYFDVAPQYGDAEIKLGPALEPYRAGVFLAGKTLERTRAGAAAELKRTLERLRTDHLDLYQLHALTDMEKDVDLAFGKGGALETFVEAKQAGVVRHLGFSAHSVEAALAAMERYDFDSILFPVNFTTYFKGDFGPSVIERAQAKRLSILALKMLCRQQWGEGEPNRQKYSKCWYQPVTDRHEAELALRFTLGQPVTAAIPPGEEPLFRLALDLALDFRPLTGAELQELKALAGGLSPVFQRA